MLQAAWARRERRRNGGNSIHGVSQPGVFGAWALVLFYREVVVRYANLTWTCHVCGLERLDKFIGVYKKSGTLELDDGRRVPFEQNIRYCLDRRACREGAPDVDLFTGMLGGWKEGE